MMWRDIVAWAWDNPPEARTRLLLADSWGCILSGLRHPRVQALRAALNDDAAAYAAAMCWDEWNDGLARAHGRPGLAVAPLVLAAPALLPTAYALGYEVAARAGEMWRIAPGMHVDGTWHALGAAAAAVRLAGGSQAQAVQAINIAACQVPFSIYAPLAAGMDGRNSYPAHAVMLGRLAAASAMAGMTAPDDAFFTARGIALPQARAACAPPGEWLLEQGYIKPFPGVRHAHYGAEAALRFHGTAPRAITLRVYGEALRYAANRAPRTPIAAQFSLSWAVAAALGRGRLTPAEFTEDALADPALRALEAMVVLQEDATLSGRGATLVVDGVAQRVESAPGDASEPVDVLAKFGALPGFADRARGILHPG
ncbi:MAG: MmgE/PrpD family protein [Alphaproteobacteria bacterium]|nr:MmgE/PrpD family protein [Alphaproteobacteria bacterium]